MRNLLTNQDTLSLYDEAISVEVHLDVLTLFCPIIICVPSVNIIGCGVFMHSLLTNKEYSCRQINFQCHHELNSKSCKIL